MQSLLILLALTMGVASAVQGATNGALSARVGLPAAVLINALVVMLGAFALWLSLPRSTSTAPPSPWFMYLGGCYGLLIIAGAAYCFPRLGAGPTTALMVAAQLCAALLLDHLGLPKEKLAITPLRMIGVLLLVVGSILVLWPRLFPRS